MIMDENPWKKFLAKIYEILIKIFIVTFISDDKVSEEIFL